MGALWERPAFREIGVNGECTAYTGQSAAPKKDTVRLNPRLRKTDLPAGGNVPTVSVLDKSHTNSAR
jgi:hypothetical protein